MMTTPPSPETLAAFKAAILAVYASYGLSLQQYRTEYDEYDSDEGLEIVPYVSGYEVERARWGGRT